MSLKERLEELFSARPGLKPAHVAKAIGCSRTSLSDWLTGKAKTIRPDYLFALANYFDVEPNWLQLGFGSKTAKYNIDIAHQLDVNTHVLAEKNARGSLVNNTGRSILQSANVEISNPLEEHMSFELIKNMYGIDNANIIHAMSLLLSLNNAKDEDKQTVEAIKVLALGVDSQKYKITVEPAANASRQAGLPEPQLKTPS